MKKIIISALILVNSFAVFSQERLQRTISELRDELKQKEELLDNLETQKTDAITRLEKQIAELEQESDKRANEEYERGKHDMYVQIAQIFDKSFDELITLSTEHFFARDLQLTDNNPEMTQKLEDLLKYYSAREILSEKYDEQKLKDAQNKLDTINVSSALLNKLKTDMEGYKRRIDMLRDLIENIEKTNANSVDTQSLKRKEILSDISEYLLATGINYNNYPHLMNIVLEIITRIQLDANADLSDLLQKL